jgi:hypothetical protein
MEPSSTNNHVDQFVIELLRTGAWCCELIDNLVEALPDDAYPGEDKGSVVVEMVRGTITMALASLDDADVVRCSEVMQLARDGVIEHLRLALELSRRVHGEADPIGHDE